MPIARPAFALSTLLTAGLMLPVMTHKTHAQLAADQGGGRALDANPGVNSRGTNRLENQVDYAARNDLITGNVAGGFGFRGSIDYTAPGAFRGTLGSENLFNFRAQSLNSSPALAPLPSGAPAHTAGGNIVVYNNFTTVPAGRVTNAGSTRFAPEGGAFRVNRDVNDANPYQVTLERSPGITLQSRDTAAINNLAPYGNATTSGLALDAPTASAPGRSPGRSPGSNPALQRPDADRPTRPDAFTRPGTDRAIPGNPNTPGTPGSPGQLDAPRDLQGPALSNYRTPSRGGNLSGNDLLFQGPADNPGLNTRAGYADDTGRVKPTLALGQAASNLATSNPRTLNQRIDEIQRNLFGPTSSNNNANAGNPTAGMMPGTSPGSTSPGTTPPGSTPADTPGRNPNALPGSPGTQASATSPGGAGGDGAGGAYTDLLEQIREQARQTTEQRRAASQMGEVDMRPDWMKAMDEPDEAKVRQAEETLEQTLDRIRSQILAERDRREAAAAGGGEGGGDGANERGGAGGEVTADQAEAREAADASLDALMSDLTYNIRLDTMVAQRETRRDELFAQAETQMAAGKFLNAERTYRQLRFEDPDNPLGEIGLVHAQLGAGMIRSAAFNLRSLFEEHPELIATRYGPDLLPPADRLEWLQKELQRLIDEEADSAEPGLMLAYLGHQVESRQLVRYGLAIAEEAAARDRLLPVLRRIWLEGNPPQPPAPEAE